MADAVMLSQGVLQHIKRAPENTSLVDDKSYVLRQQLMCVLCEDCSVFQVRDCQRSELWRADSLNAVWHQVRQHCVLGSLII